MRHYILITGGELFNKGAQAMTFAIVSEILTVSKDKKIILLSYRDSLRPDNEKSRYSFDILGMKTADILNLCGGLAKYISLIKHPDKTKIVRFKNILRMTDYIIDVSGYALSSNWGFRGTIIYLMRIYMAKHFNIPVYIFPQSFGPFLYKGIFKPIADIMIKHIMQYPEIIYTREMEGYKQLTEYYNLKNVKMSHDLVLLNRKLDLAKIYCLIPNIKRIEIKPGSIAILPNMKNFAHGNKDEIMSLYVKMINTLLILEKKIYIMRHSYEDIEACQLIKNEFINNEEVVFLPDDFSCLDYEGFVSGFDYLISSRYHSIVHAYKNFVPCIVLGWATKYHELLHTFEQSKYLFDVRISIDHNAVLKSITTMEKQYQVESKRIKDILLTVQENNNVFEAVLRKGD